MVLQPRLFVVEMGLGGEVDFADEEGRGPGVEAVGFEVEFPRYGFRHALWRGLVCGVAGRGRGGVFGGPLLVGVRAHGLQHLW